MEQSLIDLLRCLENMSTVTNISLIGQVIEATERLSAERDRFAVHNGELSREIEQLRIKLDHAKGALEQYAGGKTWRHIATDALEAIG